MWPWKKRFITCKFPISRIVKPRTSCTGTGGALFCAKPRKFSFSFVVLFDVRAEGNWISGRELTWTLKLWGREWAQSWQREVNKIAEIMRDNEKEKFYREKTINISCDWRDRHISKRSTFFPVSFKPRSWEGSVIIYRLRGRGGWDFGCGTK